MAIERPEDDFATVLQGLGISCSFDAEGVGVPVLNQADVMARISGNLPPSYEELTPLPVDQELARLMTSPIVDVAMVPELRNRFSDTVWRCINDPRLRLDANEDTLYDFRLGVSEALQNGIRAGGILAMNLMSTAEGRIYFDVHNLSLDFPPNCFHLRPGQRPLLLGRRQGIHEVDHAPDEGGWGMYLLGRLAVSQDDGRPAAGLYDVPYVEVPLLGTDQWLPISRKISWSTYGRSRGANVGQPLNRAA
jgi:hypothetical protein